MINNDTKVEVDLNRLCERLGYLCNVDLGTLRATYCISQAITTTNKFEDIKQTKKLTRGQMTKSIIMNEFDPEIEEHNVLNKGL